MDMEGGLNPCGWVDGWVGGWMDRDGWLGQKLTSLKEGVILLCRGAQGSETGLEGGEQGETA